MPKRTPTELVVDVAKRGVLASRDRETRALRRAFAGPRSRLVAHVVPG
ncbi:hypothetical protein [Streptomyces sp. NPDC054940]